MVDEVPREVQRSKPEGQQTPSLGKGFGRGTSTSDSIHHPRLFYIMSFFGHPELVQLCIENPYK